MITLLALAHVGLRISELQRSLTFYRALGFSLIRSDTTERVHVVRHPCGLELNLIERADPAGSARNLLQDEQPQRAGFTHIACEVPDLRAVHATLIGIGVTVSEGPLRFGDGSLALFIRDPDQHVIELCQRRFESREPA